MSNFRLLSASQLTCYANCSMQWAFRYREKAPEESRSAALVVGTALDTSIKTIVHQIRAGEATIASLKPKDILHEAWSAEKSAKPDLPIAWGEKGEVANFKTAEALVEAFVRLPDLEQRVARLVSVDLRFELPVHNPRTGLPVAGLGVQGILDAVERVDGRLRALDWKTSASRAGWAIEDLRWHVQGSVYAWALKELHGDDASDDVAFAIGLKLVKAPVWEDRVASFPKAAQDRALLTLIAAAQSMDRATPFPQPGWMCGGCAYAKRCDRWQEEADIELRRDPFAA